MNHTLLFAFPSHLSRHKNRCFLPRVAALAGELDDPIWPLGLDSKAVRSASFCHGLRAKHDRVPSDCFYRLSTQNTITYLFTFDVHASPSAYVYFLRSLDFNVGSVPRGCFESRPLGILVMTRHFLDMWKQCVKLLPTWPIVKGNDGIFVYRLWRSITRCT